MNETTLPSFASSDNRLPPVSLHPSPGPPPPFSRSIESPLPDPLPHRVETIDTPLVPSPVHSIVTNTKRLPLQESLSSLESQQRLSGREGKTAAVDSRSKSEGHNEEPVVLRYRSPSCDHVLRPRSPKSVLWTASPVMNDRTLIPTRLRPSGIEREANDKLALATIDVDHDPPLRPPHKPFNIRLAYKAIPEHAESHPHTHVARPPPVATRTYKPFSERDDSHLYPIPSYRFGRIAQATDYELESPSREHRIQDRMLVNFNDSPKTTGRLHPLKTSTPVRGMRGTDRKCKLISTHRPSRIQPSVSAY